MKAHILIIEDETHIARIIKMEMEMEGYQVTVEHDGRAGLETALQTDIDLILLDVMLPSLNGIEVLRRLRYENTDVPVILLTARNTTLDIVAGLDQGANDYVAKPFKMEELLARIRAFLRNQPKSIQKNSVLNVKDLIIDSDTREVVRNGKTISLTPKEYDFLLYLVMNKNKVVTRDSILLNVWGLGYEGETNIIDVTVAHLRKKIDEGFSSQLFTTVRGVGYTIKE
ncbi:DNA-binding response regulator [Bacillus sp. MUM 116]|uniref:response regulator transcription factor n=1 Tax=Bacillus sp. MUM 116 TaxID=1678002 RepID=UPI0008F5A1D6|nr:response regulator transcription factor [Bacillus sp. MUM 116]OIK16397.1 DNA-binding response regulator [Bacillus sp. MUM 116]